jgi:isoleucyl-tRNA synthetase
LDKLTVALDVNISVELKNEGIARELINRIQTLRKELKFEVTDKINVTVSNSSIIADAIKNNLSYISTEILANSFKVENNLTVGERVEIETTELNVLIEKV